jgi:predicted phosphodiesterase
MTRAELVRDYCKRFPRHGNLTLAKAIYKECPQAFHSLESARSVVRLVRGARGKEHRRRGIKDKSLFRELGYAGQPPLELPRSIAKSWEPYKLETSRNVILSDIHIPFHDDEALSLAIAETVKYRPDGIILNGDITDFFAVSRWERDPREVNLKREIDQTVEFFAYMRQRFPKSKIVWKQGNHEERWEHYLWRKAPELLNVDSFDVAEIFKLNQFRIELVRDKRIIMAGKLPVLHGHEFPKGLTNPVNQARGMFLRGLECAIAGHGHRSSEHAEASLLGKLITCWSTGCLCNLNPEYAVINKWNHGFAFVEISKGGEFHVTNKRIYRGAVW